jgi:hypothetical protein
MNGQSTATPGHTVSHILTEQQPTNHKNRDFFFEGEPQKSRHRSRAPRPDDTIHLTVRSCPRGAHHQPVLRPRRSLISERPSVSAPFLAETARGSGSHMSLSPRERSGVSVFAASARVSQTLREIRAAVEIGEGLMTERRRPRRDRRVACDHKARAPDPRRRGISPSRSREARDTRLRYPILGRRTTRTSTVRVTDKRTSRSSTERWFSWARDRHPSPEPGGRVTGSRG